MGRSCTCCSKVGLNKEAWTATEDKILTDYVKTHGEGKWGNIPKAAGLKRSGKSCRLRWLNYLRPDIKRGNLTDDEEDLIIRLHRLLGNRWSLIAGRLPGRTDNEIKNYWNTKLSKKLQTKNAYLSKVEKKPISERPGVVTSPAVVSAKATCCNPGSHSISRQQYRTEKQYPDLALDLPVESQSRDGTSFPILSKEENSSSSDRTVDFDVSFSEVLDSSFHKLYDFGNIYNTDNVMEEARNNENYTKLRSGQAFLINEEMVNNWNINGDECLQANLDSDLGCSAYFLELGPEEWMI